MTEPPRWAVSAKAVVLRDGAVLLGRNDRGEWELPGGRVERGEQPEEAVVREVAEETGLEVAPTALLGVRVMEVLPRREVLIVGYACAERRERSLRTSDEHAEVRWHPLGELDGIALPAVYRDLIARARRR